MYATGRYDTFIVICIYFVNKTPRALRLYREGIRDKSRMYVFRVFDNRVVAHVNRVDVPLRYL